jgi:hypothetical protein
MPGAIVLEIASDLPITRTGSPPDPEHSRLTLLVQFRDLQPATAFHESKRGAIPIAICGFFAEDLLTSFGVLPAIDERFQFLAGFAVVAGLFQWIRF